MSARIAQADALTLAEGVARLRRGELVAFPTETVYGLGADAGNANAVRAIFNAKGRPADHPVIVHIATMQQLERWARTVPDAARKLAAAFWPGPLTLILPRSALAQDVVTGGQDSVGLRMPSHPVARSLLRAFAAAGGEGIAAPSANRYGRISPTTAQHVADDLGTRVPLIIDGGPCAIGIESTIVAFADEGPMLLRPGGISLADLTRVLGHAPLAPNSAAPRASGTLAAHYAPRTPSRLVAPEALLREVAEAGAQARAPVAVLARMIDAPAQVTGLWLAAAQPAAAYAHDLYANLRALDAVAASEILIESVPTDEAWLAIADRLRRAVHAEDDDRD